MKDEDFTFPKNSDNDVDLVALMQVFDTTFGRSSTVKSSSYSVKMSMVNERQVLVSYMVVVNFGSENEKFHMKRKYEAESLDIINDALKIVKKEYKDIADKTITFKEAGSETSVEMIFMSGYCPKKTAYFRRKTIFDVK